MREFARLLDALAFQPARNGKLALLVEYFSTAPDPDRGYTLAALAGTLDLPTAKPKLIRELVAERVDPELFRMSYDYVGDLAETAALIWPEPDTAEPPAEPPGMTDVVTRLNSAGRTETPAIIAGWL
ncbi:MAG: ATP-dependent DNA ligase, partial [Alphaproteobacteria bacterium]|nr:ATP-dependent DNA ligase [Alphaproteobacteria bacterium]